MPKTVEGAIAELRQYVNEAMNEHQWTYFPSIKRQLELHPSGFPYCPLRFLFNALQEPVPVVSATSFSTEYFTSVGTLVHTLIQTAMGLGGKVWGHWRCSQHPRRCAYESLDELTVYHDCPHCGSYCVYEEIGYKVHRFDDDGNEITNEPPVLVGHQDCLYEDSDGFFWVVDYKTCMLIKAQKHISDGVALAGNNTYRAQQRAYVTLSHRKYGKSHGIKPRGWILAYLPRDNPFSPAFYGEEVSGAEKREIWGRICHDIDAHTVVLDAEGYEDIAHLIDTKPCTSLKHYKQHMESPYSECPLLPVCFNKKQLVNTLKSELDGHVMLPLRRTFEQAIIEQEYALAEIENEGKPHTTREK